MQTRQEKNRPGLNSVAPLAAAMALGLCYGSAAAQSAPNQLANAELLEILSKVTQKIGDGEPWADCREMLESAVADLPESKYVRRCRDLIESIRLTEQIEARLTPPDQLEPDQLTVEHLVFSKIDVGRIMQPLYLARRSTFMWDWDTQLGDHQTADIAHRIYLKKRDVLEPLTDLLDNQAATRSVRVPKQGAAEPVVLRVCDVALGLIEAISHCRFRTDKQLYVPFSLCSAPVRNETIENVNRWWRKTKDMSPGEAVVWQIENGGVPNPYQMLQGLMAMDEKEAVIAHLSKKFRTSDSIDYEASVRLIQAGSTEPLEYIHHAVANRERVTLEMVRVIGARGRWIDFELLDRLVMSTDDSSPPRPRNWHSSVVVQGLRSSKNRKCIPVLVAVVDQYVTKRMEDVSNVAPPSQHIVLAAAKVQEMTGVNFGLDPNDSDENINAALNEMLRWWREDGQSVYGFHALDRHAPGGIR